MSIRKSSDLVELESGSKINSQDWINFRLPANI